MEGGAITLTDCQRKKLINSFKNNKNVFLRLKANQVDPSKINSKNAKYLSRTKTGYSLSIDSSEVKTGGFLPLLFGAMGATAGIASAAYNIIKGASDSNEQKRHNKKMEDIAERKGSGNIYKCCDKCSGKGMTLK